MDIKKLSEKAVQDFILGNKSVDIKKLALEPIPFDGELRTQILQQIQSHQKAKDKLESWATRKGIIFPNPDLVEQASSDSTAKYKAGIYPQNQYPHNFFIDLTAGLGSDSLAFSEKFTSGLCIEADPTHASLLEYNLKILSNKKIDILNGYAEELINSLPNADLIYIDPQRRNTSQNGSNKRGIFNFSETSPNILELLPTLKEKSSFIMIKSSPFLDIYEGLRQLGNVQDVHVVESQGQCKEVLYVINQRESGKPVKLTSANCDHEVVFQSSLEELHDATPDYHPPLGYLFEPGPALMKSGQHILYAIEHQLKKLAPMTHLYTSEHPIPSNMGRSFEVLDVLPVKKKEVHAALETPKANISVRNFPMKPEELRKKLELKDGGEFTLFGTTLFNNEKKIILCKHQPD